MKLLPLIALLVLTSACTTETEPPGPQAPVCEPESWDGALQVGGGEDCFEGLSTGEIVPLIAGPQGGFHVWLAVRCRGCEPGATVAYAVKDAAGDFMMGQSQQGVVEMQDADDYRHGAGIQAMMPGDGFTTPTYLRDAFALWVEMNIDGQVVSDEVAIIIDGIERMRSNCSDCN